MTRTQLDSVFLNVQTTLLALVRQRNRRPRGIRVSVPPERRVGDLRERLASWGRGQGWEMEVELVPRPGPPTLLAVDFERWPA